MSRLDPQDPIDRVIRAAGFAGAQMAKRGLPVRREKDRLVFPVDDEHGPLGVEVVVDLKPGDQEARSEELPSSANPSNAALADALARGAAGRFGVRMERIVASSQMADRLTQVPKTIRYVFIFPEGEEP